MITCILHFFYFYKFKHMATNRFLPNLRPLKENKDSALLLELKQEKKRTNLKIN